MHIKDVPTSSRYYFVKSQRQVNINFSSFWKKNPFSQISDILSAIELINKLLSQKLRTTLGNRTLFQFELCLFL